MGSKIKTPTVVLVPSDNERSRPTCSLAAVQTKVHKSRKPTHRKWEANQEVGSGHGRWLGKPRPEQQKGDALARRPLHDQDQPDPGGIVPPKRMQSWQRLLARSCTRSWAIIFRPAVKQVTKRMIRVIHLIVTEQIPIAKGKGGMHAVADDTVSQLSAESSHRLREAPPPRQSRGRHADQMPKDADPGSYCCLRALGNSTIQSVCLSSSEIALSTRTWQACSSILGGRLKARLFRE